MLDNEIEVDQSLESLSPVLIPSSNVKGGFIKAYILKKIHSFKPLACQLYPFAVRKSEEGFIALIHPDTVCKFIETDVKEDDSNTVEIVKGLISLLSLE